MQSRILFAFFCCFSVLLVAACCGTTSPEGSACGAYCGTTHTTEEMAGRCKTAFGAQYSVVRQCATTPRTCLSLTKYSPELSAPCADGSNEPVQCCTE